MAAITVTVRKKNSRYVDGETVDLEGSRILETTYTPAFKTKQEEEDNTPTGTYFEYTGYATKETYVVDETPAQLKTLRNAGGGDGGGSTDVSALNKEVTQLDLLANAKHKKNRIKGSANYSSVISYVGATDDVASIEHTGTTDLGVETLTETFTYDGSNRITNITYS